MSEKEQWDKYCQWSYEEFFAGIPVGSNVIEIGPGYGFHSALIQRQKPAFHRVIAVSYTHLTLPTKA